MNEPDSNTYIDLSGRELDVLKLLVGGLSNKQIAAELGLSHETIKSHMRNILRKLSVSGRTHAAVRALHLGLTQ